MSKYMSDLDGTIEIRFLNGSEITIEVDYIMKTAEMIPLTIVDKNGWMHNWQTIMSVRQVKN